MTFKLAVVGSRRNTSKKDVINALEQAPWIPNNVQTLTCDDVNLEIVTGGADGVDTFAEEWALSQGFDVTIHKPNWSDWSGEHPAKKRNTEIIEDGDAVLAVWNGKSVGTRDSIDKALDRGKPLYVDVVDG